MAEFVRFESTLWSVLSQAKHGKREAVDKIITRYQAPILAFIQNRGFPREDAEDLMQEVFVQIIKDDLLAKADSQKGRFRTLLLAVTNNVIRMELRKRGTVKRGSGQRPASLDASDDGPLPVSASDELQDEEFDRVWIWNLLGSALERLKKEHSGYHAPLQLQIDESLAYEQIGTRLGMSPTDVRNALHRGRQALTKYVRESIAEYSSSKEEYEAELKYLSKFVEKPEDRRRDQPPPA